MSYTNGTTHYNLPQTIGSDKRDWSDTNKAFADIDSAIYSASNGVNTLTPQVNTMTSDISTNKSNIATNKTNITNLTGRVTTTEQNISNLTNTVSDVKTDAQDMITSNHESSATASKAYAVGDYFIYNDTLYIATSSIAKGATIVPNTNCSTVTVTNRIASLEKSGLKRIALSFSSSDTWGSFLKKNYNTIHNLLSITQPQHGAEAVLAYTQSSNTSETYLHLSQQSSSGEYQFICNTYTSSSTRIWFNIVDLKSATDTTFVSGSFLNGSAPTITTYTDDSADISSAYLIYI